MTSPWQYALTVGPLGFYLWVLALWQSDKHPRVVRGLIDFAMLAFGVGGLVAFGPFGQLLSRMLFGRFDLLERLIIVSGLGLWASIRARGALNRLVVYHVEADKLVAELDDVLIHCGRRFVRTLDGFDDRASGSGLRIEYTRWARCAVVEATGPNAHALICEIRPGLEQRLRGLNTPPSSVALTLYGCSILVMLVPLLGMFLTQPRAREVLRVLLERLRGG